MSANVITVVLRMIALICAEWPAFGELLSLVTTHPDFEGDSVAQRIREILPVKEESESAKAAAILKGKP